MDNRQACYIVVSAASGNVLLYAAICCRMYREMLKECINQYKNIFYMPSVNTTINIIYKIFYYYGYRKSHNKKSYILLIIIKRKEKESKPKKKKREKTLNCK